MLRRCLPLFAFVLVVLSLADAQTPLRLVNVPPCRLVDTRQGSPIQGGHSAVFNLQALAEAGGFCAPFSLASAAAYSLNVTLVPITGGPVGYLTIWPTGETQPLVSLMNSDGRVKANAAIVPAGASGEVSVFVTNTTNVLIDIDAYFTSPATTPSALAFFPLTPCRIVDTRSGNGGTLQAGQERDFTIPPNCEVPSNAAAYSFNVTVLPTQGELDYLTVWPKGESRPVVSTLNDGTGTIVANAAIVPAGADNATAFYPHDHNTDLLLDVNGYFAPASSASNPLSLFTLTPCRILDTRSGIGLFNGTIPVGIVGGACGVPGASPQGFVLNSTVVPDGDLLFLSLWPEGLTQPTVSTLNANDGAVTSNMAIVPAGTGNDSIDVYAPTDTQLILDISSYFAAVSPLIIQTTSPLPVGTLHDNYGVQLVAIGGVPPYTWQKTAGNLPAGLAYNSGGLISGTTTGTGTSNFTFQVTDSNSPASMTSTGLQITVNLIGQTLGVTTTSLAAATVNTFYNALLAANGGVTPYTWSISSGSLPTGLSLNAGTGQITGQAASSGLWQFTVKVTDHQQNTATHALAISVNTGDANGTLNGTYAFSFSGYIAGDPFTWVGSFVTDGNGNIPSGEYDIDDSSGVSTKVSVTGTYSINSNGLGQITLHSRLGTDTLGVATGSGEDMRILYLNQYGPSGVWGAGVVRQQNPSDFNEAALAGNWAFGLQGIDLSGDPEAADGAFHLSGGTISNGIEDINDFGTHSQVTLTGTVTSSPPFDANGRGTVRVTIDGIPINEAVYVISAGEMVLMDIDTGGNMFVENTLRQSGTFNQGSLNGNSIGRGSRKAKADSDSPKSEALVVQVATDGNGNISFAEDINSGGTFGTALQTGMYVVSSDSRTVFTLTSGATIVCYLIASNEGYCINATAASGNDNSGAEVIYFEPQSAGPFSDASFSGEYLGGSLPQYLSSTLSQIDTNVSSGAATFSSTYTWSGPNGTQQDQTLTGTYTVDPTTGAITISVGGSPVYAGYIVSPNKVEYVTATQESNPLVLVEVTSSAPRHP